MSTPQRLTFLHLGLLFLFIISSPHITLPLSVPLSASPSRYTLYVSLSPTKPSSLPSPLLALALRLLTPPSCEVYCCTMPTPNTVAALREDGWGYSLPCSSLSDAVLLASHLPPHPPPVVPDSLPVFVSAVDRYLTSAEVPTSVPDDLRSVAASEEVGSIAEEVRRLSRGLLSCYHLEASSSFEQGAVEEVDGVDVFRVLTAVVLSRPELLAAGGGVMSGYYAKARASEAAVNEKEFGEGMYRLHILESIREGIAAGEGWKEGVEKIKEDQRRKAEVRK